MKKCVFLFLLLLISSRTSSSSLIESPARYSNPSIGNQWWVDENLLDAIDAVRRKRLNGKQQEGEQQQEQQHERESTQEVVGGDCPQCIVEMDGAKLQEWLDSIDGGAGHWLAQYDLPLLLDSHGGLVRLEGFLPDWVARAMRALLADLPDKHWARAHDSYAKGGEGKDGGTHLAEHTFWMAHTGGVRPLLRLFSLLQPEAYHVFSAARYLRGDGIRPHDDRAEARIMPPHSTRGVRVWRDIAVIYYLNPDWARADGGLLRDLVTGEEHVPAFNTLVAFRVPRAHEVTPVSSSRARFSIFGWFFTTAAAPQQHPEELSAGTAATVDSIEHVGYLERERLQLWLDFEQAGQDRQDLQRRLAAALQQLGSAGQQADQDVRRALENNLVDLPPPAPAQQQPVALTRPATRAPPTRQLLSQLWQSLLQFGVAAVDGWDPLAAEGVEGQLSCFEEASRLLPSCEQGWPAKLSFEWPPPSGGTEAVPSRERLPTLRGDFELPESQWRTDRTSKDSKDSKEDSKESKESKESEESEGDAPCCECLERFMQSLDVLSAFAEEQMKGRLVLDARPERQGMLTCFPPSPSGRIGFGMAQQKPHLDSHEDDRRVLTLEYYVTPDWDSEREGGQLRLELAGKQARPGQTFQVAPKHNRLVIYLSEEVVHQVLPTRGRRPRLAATAWISILG
eukprot:g66226.t1